PRRPPVSVHENDQTVSHIPLSGDPTVGSVRVAEEAVKALKTALRELGEPVPANDVRAVLTTSGLRLEVTAAPSTTVEHYGTPAPVDEVAEFLGEKEPFAVGDRARIAGSGPGGAPETEGIKRCLPVGEVGTATVITPVGSAAVRVGDTENFVSLR